MKRARAERLYDGKFWEWLSPRERAIFQLQEDRLCMPFLKFQQAVETCVNRPVSDVELALRRQELIEEILIGGDTDP